MPRCSSGLPASNPCRVRSSSLLGLWTFQEPWAEDYYQRKRKEGKTHSMAVRAAPQCMGSDHLGPSFASTSPTWQLPSLRPSRLMVVWPPKTTERCQAGSYRCEKLPFIAIDIGCLHGTSHFCSSPTAQLLEREIQLILPAVSTQFPENRGRGRMSCIQ